VGTIDARARDTTCKRAEKPGKEGFQLSIAEFVII
jgi:hypothetical protein